jgi:K+-transporting ATPase ATPase A chain
MSEFGFYQVVIFLLALILLIKPLGWYMARVYQGQNCGLNWFMGPIERCLYRVCCIDPKQEMDWKRYLFALLWFNCIGVIFAYLVQRFQYYLPLNPQQFPAPSPALAFNTASSFTSNTDWQAYSGESTLSYFSQSLVCTVQNFLSAATGMSVLIALIRGITQQESTDLGNFWVDMVRSVLYILLPISMVLAILLAQQGVMQNFKAYQKILPLQTWTASHLSESEPRPLGSRKVPLANARDSVFAQGNEQIIPMGPVASQVAIKQLGTNGGGFFNTNAGHPFENPTPWSNFLEMLALMLIPAAFCYTFGIMVKNLKQGYVLLIAMFVIYIPAMVCAIVVEQAGNPAIHQLGVNLTPQKNLSPGGNMEGKETRNGIVSSVIWAVSTTASSNGSVNAMHDSFIPLAGMMPLWMMALQDNIFGGVGSGLYGMLTMVLIAVFIAGLMVGRSPEYLGKKIEPFEMKMASVSILIIPILVLMFTGLACVTSMGTSAISTIGPHGFTQILYAFTSMSNNNGSALAGLNANTPFYLIAGGLVMLISRYWIIISILALAGSLVKKKRLPQTTGTLATDTPLFLIFLMSVILIIGALSFLPALALGPIVEQLKLWGMYAH